MDCWHGGCRRVKRSSGRNQQNLIIFVTISIPADAHFHLNWSWKIKRDCTATTTTTITGAGAEKKRNQYCIRNATAALLIPLSAEEWNEKGDVRTYVE